MAAGDPATTAMTTTANDLVAYVNKLLELKDKSLDFAADIKKGDVAPVVTAVVANAQSLLDKEAETDVEGCFRMLCELLCKLPAEKVNTEVKQLVTVLVAAKDDTALLRLRILTNLFNKLSDFPERRLETLLVVIQYASDSDQLDLVTSYFDCVTDLIDAKVLTPEKLRQLYLLIANVLQKAEAKSNKVLVFLDKYLATCTDKDAAAAKDVAVRALTTVVKMPVASLMARVDLVNNPAVLALKKDTKHAKLVQLLEIYSSQTIKEYLAFEESAGAAFFKDFQLNQETCAEVMRLFTLCSLPANFEEKSFATLAAALQIEESNVEKFVVKAITANLVSAKIDQLNRTVVISRTFQRSFGVDQWKQMDATLESYKSNVKSLLEVVRNARKAHDPTQA